MIDIGKDTLKRFYSETFEIQIFMDADRPMFFSEYRRQCWPSHPVSNISDYLHILMGLD